MTRYYRTQFFRMKKVFTGQHFHRIAFDSSSVDATQIAPPSSLIQDLKKMDLQHYNSLPMASYSLYRESHLTWILGPGKISIMKN